MDLSFAKSVFVNGLKSMTILSRAEGHSLSKIYRRTRVQNRKAANIIQTCKNSNCTFKGTRQEVNEDTLSCGKAVGTLKDGIKSLKRIIETIESDFQLRNKKFIESITKAAYTSFVDILPVFFKKDVAQMFHYVKNKMYTIPLSDGLMWRLLEQHSNVFIF